MITDSYLYHITLPLTRDSICSPPALIAPEVAEQTREFIRTSTPALTAAARRSGPPASYEERASLVKHRVARNLLNIVKKKKTNLCVAIDVTTTAELLRLTRAVAPFVCAVKTHIDAIEDFVYKKVRAPPSSCRNPTERSPTEMLRDANVKQQRIFTELLEDFPQKNFSSDFSKNRELILPRQPS